MMRMRRRGIQWSRNEKKKVENEEDGEKEEKYCKLVRISKKKINMKKALEVKYRGSHPSYMYVSSYILNTD